MDSWHAKGPFLKKVVEELGWPVIAALKQKRYEVCQEALALTVAEPEAPQPADQRSAPHKLLPDLPPLWSRRLIRPIMALKNSSRLSRTLPVENKLGNSHSYQQKSARLFAGRVGIVRVSRLEACSTFSRSRVVARVQGRLAILEAEQAPLQPAEAPPAVSSQLVGALRNQCRPG